MGYPKYEEDNRKLQQERCTNYGCFYEQPPRREEYVPYAVRYQLPQPKSTPRKKKSYVYSW